MTITVNFGGEKLQVDIGIGIYVYLYIDIHHHLFISFFFFYLIFSPTFSLRDGGLGPWSLSMRIILELKDARIFVGTQ